MASVTVSGTLIASSGLFIPLQNTSQAEGTEFSLTTNATYTTTQQEIGDYAPGASLVAGEVVAPNGISYAYILRQGLILAIINVGIKGAVSTGPQMLPGGAVTIQPGDVLRVMSNTAADRECAVQVLTKEGTPRIFTVTPSTGATNEPTDLQTGNSVGNTLQGQQIVKASVTSVDGSKIDGGGVLMINEQGQPVGAINATNPIKVQPGWSNVNIPCELNYTWTLVTSS